MSTEHLRAVFDKTLAWSKAQGYLEHTKHDALNSKLIWSIFGHHRLTRILATQAVMRFPIDIRDLIGVPRSHNPKGLALFCMALLDAYALTGEESYSTEARRLLALLLELRSPGDWHGDCWGYQYPWQDLGFFAPKATPNAVVTAFVCEAFLQAHRILGDASLLVPVRSATHFFRYDLAILKETDTELCLGYMPLDMKMRVMDVSILIASVLSQLGRIDNDPALHAMAQRLARYVVNRQTRDGAWYYTDPPSDSPVRVDNYHTGFIVDALERVIVSSGMEEWRINHRRGLDFYARNLFNADGSPRWMSDRDYPHDIHGASQGIITFSQAGNRDRYPELAGKIMDWALSRMYSDEGRFYYQETRHRIKKVTYIRWCNAWMCRALAQHWSRIAHETHRTS